MRVWLRRSILLLCLVLLPPLAAAATPAPELQAGEQTSRAGYFRLSWAAPHAEGAQFALERAHHASFTESREIYRGADTARVESGLPDGAYYYRVRVVGSGAAQSAWSAPARVEVAHHPLPRALAFLFVGLLVFVATFALIVRGARAAAKERT